MTETTWRVRSWAPGRVEIAGNHTDHQGGRVVSAAVAQGVTMLLRANGTDRARVESEGYAPFELDVTAGDPVEAERNTSAAMVRGVIAGLRTAGVPVAGFDVRVTSTLPSGGGMSSSAAFELACARGLALLFGTSADADEPANDASRPWLAPVAGLAPMDFIRVAVAAERTWFGKPCGFQDQTASTFGGICDMDFSNLEEPQVSHIDFDFPAHGYRICLVDTRADHSAHTGDFNQLVADMGVVAAHFGESVLGRVNADEFFRQLPAVRRACGDSATLRAWHFFNESELVDARAEALRAGDSNAFIKATRLSGLSSAEYLQNVSVPGSTNQPAMVALAMCRRALADRGAARIHGGGFGGTIQAYVPVESTDAFAAQVEEALGRGVCTFVEIGREGASASWIH